MTMNLKEILDATKPNRQAIGRCMEQTKPFFHPEDASIYTGLKQQQQNDIQEYLTKIPLKRLVEKLAREDPSLKEYLGHSGALTTGATGEAGANYLLPDKIYAELFENARCADITPIVSNVVDTPGATLKIDVEKDGTFKPHFGASGGEAPDETIETAQGTITPRLFSINIGVTNEMIEDSLFDQMETHVRIAGKAMGEWSTKMCLFPIMEDHRGTTTTFRVEGAYNGVNSGGATTFDISDVLEAEGANSTDGFDTTHLIIPPHGPQTLLLGAAGYPHDWTKLKDVVNLSNNPIANICGIDVVRVKHITTSDTSDETSYIAGLYATSWHALAVNKTYGIQTVRKRWLKIENYSDPIRDLVGAVVSARQGHLVAYADACCVINYA